MSKKREARMMAQKVTTLPGGKVHEYGPSGEVRLLAIGDGYAMVRFPRCIPFVVSLKEWLAMPLIGDKR